ncbi:MAG: hypothetical protein ACTSRP_19510 [Candidatus Helarchaeota archaeon]
MKVDVEKIDETKNRIRNLINDLKVDHCNENAHIELQEILNKIGTNQELMKKYEDIWTDAEDALIFSSTNEGCKCDPIRKRIPRDKPAH